jgi:hypothetical protein
MGWRWIRCMGWRLRREVVNEVEEGAVHEVEGEEGACGGPGG